MDNVQFPPLQLSMTKKTKAWRKQCVSFADSKLHFNYSLVRHSLIHLTINYDLVAGKLHMDDLALLYNPQGIKAGFIPDKILHYPIMNSKLNVLRGEESRRVFDYRVIVTNPNAISEVEEDRKVDLFQSLLQHLQNTALSQDDFLAGLLKIQDYYNYEWQDFREVRANSVLNHYSKEQDFSLIFNNGFMDALTVGEEIYLVDIIGGEPVLQRLNPKKVRIFKSGYSNKIEDADMIILEDYWSPGKVIDVFGLVLTKKDMEYIESFPDHFSQGAVDNMDNIDERYGFVNSHMITDTIADSTMFFDPLGQYSDSVSNELLPYDLNGNIRVIRVYWKSRRKIKKIKYYNPITGEEEFTFMPENYIPNTYKGEEEESFWINEAWEGTKIGLEIYVNMRPRVVQYNRLSNPSVCHFGIIGTVYNFNDDKPFSMVDMMKPYNYLYDIIHDRLNKMMARNWGKMTRLDFSKKPKNWKIEKWLYYAKTMGLFVEDSFNEGNMGQAKGVLAGSMNNNSQAVIDADFGNNILLYINLLEWIKSTMGEIAGISKQREGLIANRETVGGVERATLQSSNITEWIFQQHDDTKKRVLEAFLETFKIAYKGRVKKFLYILPNYSLQISEINGDEFAECDYGLVVDSSNATQELGLKLDALALAALQNQALSFSTIMKLYTSASLAEKQRMVELNEQQMLQQQQLQQQQQQQLLQQQIQALQLMKQQELQAKDNINKRDNDTKVMVAEINSQAEMALLLIKNHMTEDDAEKDGIDVDGYTQKDRDLLMLQMKELDLKMQLSREKLEWDKEKSRESNDIKRKQLNSRNKK